VTHLIGRSSDRGGRLAGAGFGPGTRWTMPITSPRSAHCEARPYDKGRPSASDVSAAESRWTGFSRGTPGASERQILCFQKAYQSGRLDFPSGRLRCHLCRLCCPSGPDAQARPLEGPGWTRRYLSFHAAASCLGGLRVWAMAPLPCRSNAAGAPDCGWRARCVPDTRCRGRIRDRREGVAWHCQPDRGGCALAVAACARSGIAAAASQAGGSPGPRDSPATEPPEARRRPDATDGAPRFRASCSDGFGGPVPIRPFRAVPEDQQRLLRAILLTRQARSARWHECCKQWVSGQKPGCLL
jgi:hypothetical protein